MIIRPYSQIAQAAFVPSDYPALKHHFGCDEGSGSSLIDKAGGVVLDDILGGMVNAYQSDGSVILATQKNSILQGQVASPGSKKVVVISIGKPDDTITSNESVIFGSVASNTGAGFVVRGGSSGNAPLVNNLLPTAVSGSSGLTGVVGGTQYQARCLILDFGTTGSGSTYGITQYDYDGTSWVWRSPVSLASISGIPTISQGINIQLYTNPALIQMWHFNAVPQDFKAATLWMFENAKKGIKQPYPGWKGIV